MTMSDATSRASLPTTEPARTSRTPESGPSPTGRRRRRRAGRAAVATLLAAVGCTAVVAGMSGVAAATMTPAGARVTTPAAPPPSAPCRSITGRLCGQRTVVLNDRDGGQTITVARGTEITVTLSGQAGVWAEPRTTDDAVVHRLTGHRSADGSASGTFVAQRDGTADITSTMAPHCSGICPLWLKVWAVHILVRG
jgi:hypothetical protein